MLPCTTKLADLTWKPTGVILSGGNNRSISLPPSSVLTDFKGPSSVYDEGAPRKTSFAHMWLTSRADPWKMLILLSLTLVSLSCECLETAGLGIFTLTDMELQRHMV